MSDPVYEALDRAGVTVIATDDVAIFRLPDDTSREVAERVIEQVKQRLGGRALVCVGIDVGVVRNVDDIDRWTVFDEEAESTDA